jgi:hypothetical protein
VAGSLTVSTPAEAIEGKGWPIINYESKGCLGDGTAGPCGYVDQLWMHGSENSIRNWGLENLRQDGLHRCLDANAVGTVNINPCNGGNYQKWTHYSEGYLKNWATKQCLDLEIPEWNYARTAPCNHSDQQKWAFKY